MKKTFSVIIALFLILGFRLATYSSDAPSEPTPFPTPTKASTFESKISAEVTPSPTPTDELVIVERISVAVSPVPTEDRIVGEVTPSPMPVGDPVTGKELFASACKFCHSKDMVKNEFVASNTDQELVEFITIGGFPDQPLVMLPKGGKPSLTDEKLYDIVAYLRTLQK